MREKLIEPIESVRLRENCVEEVDDELRDWLRNQGVQCRSWTDPPESYHSPHDHPYSHRVLGVKGSIIFTVVNDDFELKKGDALDLPSGVTHEAVTDREKPTEYWLLRPES